MEGSLIEMFTITDFICWGLIAALAIWKLIEIGKWIDERY